MTWSKGAGWLSAGTGWSLPILGGGGGGGITRSYITGIETHGIGFLSSCTIGSVAVGAGTAIVLITTTGSGGLVIGSATLAGVTLTKRAVTDEARLLLWTGTIPAGGVSGNLIINASTGTIDGAVAQVLLLTGNATEAPTATAVQPFAYAPSSVTINIPSGSANIVSWTVAAEDSITWSDPSQWSANVTEDATILMPSILRQSTGRINATGSQTVTQGLAYGAMLAAYWT